MLEMIIMVGFPLSGKSTLAEKIAKKGYVIVCPDDVRLAIHGQKFYGPAEPVVWGVVDVMARSLLLRGQSIIIDATNVTEWERNNWIKLAERMEANWVISWKHTSKEECIGRAFNDGRPEMVEVIERLADKFEPIERWE